MLTENSFKTLSEEELEEVLIEMRSGSDDPLFLLKGENMAEAITINGIELEFDEEVFRSIPTEALEELVGGIGEDTPEEVANENAVMRTMTREGHIMSDMTNWYSTWHGKWNSRAGNPVNKITIHHMAGNLSTSQMEACVYNPNRQMSCNYAIYSDGTMECFVGEQYRSWCSSSWENDKNAITIEVANNSLAPNWTVSDASYKKLIKLCADICKRYGITPKYTGKTTGSLTVHRMFSNTSCPGPYLMKLHENGTIAKDINAILNPPAPAPTPVPKPSVKVIYRVQCGAFKVRQNAVKLAKKLNDAGYKTVIKTENGYVKVQTGSFAVKANADKMLAELKAKGYPAVIVEVKA